LPNPRLFGLARIGDLAALDRSRLQHVVAAHLSQKNNTPELARAALARVLGCADEWVGVATQGEGFGWRGQATVGRKAEWPDWHPPKEMRLRQPELPEKMPGGPENPLGARALYLFQGTRDTLYRIHGTAEPWTIGTDVSSGCIRLLNEEIVDLYLRTPIGTRVVVL